MAVALVDLVNYHIDSNGIKVSEFEWLIKSEFEKIMEDIAPKYVWSDDANETIYKDGYITDFIAGKLKEKELPREFVLTIAHVIGLSENQLNDTIKLSKLKSMAKKDVKKYNKANK